MAQVDPRGSAAYPADDFPFYNDRPVALSGGKWMVVLAGVVLGFLVLTAPVPFFATTWGQWIPAILFFAIPLAALAWAAPGHWTAIFRRLRARDVMWMVLIALLNIVVSLCVALPIQKIFGAEANPVGDLLRGQDAAESVVFFLRTIPQLFGEEVLTVLPFLAFMWFLHTRLKLARTPALLLAWLGAAVVFGMAHLPTYNWNWLQCLVIIGSARLVLLLAYLKTRNIWVSTGAHIINDWVLFGTIMGLGALAPQA